MCVGGGNVSGWCVQYVCICVYGLCINSTCRVSVWCVFVSVSVYVCVCVCECVCMCVSMMCVCVCDCVCMCLCLWCVSVCVCVCGMCVYL